MEKTHLSLAWTSALLKRCGIILTEIYFPNSLSNWRNKHDSYLSDFHNEQYILVE